MRDIENSEGRVLAVSVSSKKGDAKTPVPCAELREGHGLVGDAHAGGNHRQVSLLAREDVRSFEKKEHPLSPGDFAENITTEGIDLSRLKTGDRLLLGQTVLLEVSQLGKECHAGCRILELMGDCLMPRKGIFARVLNGGRVNPGDKIRRG